MSILASSGWKSTWSWRRFEFILNSYEFSRYWLVFLSIFQLSLTEMILSDFGKITNLKVTVGLLRSTSRPKFSYSLKVPKYWIPTKLFLSVKINTFWASYFLLTFLATDLKPYCIRTWVVFCVNMNNNRYERCVFVYSKIKLRKKPVLQKCAPTTKVRTIFVVERERKCDSWIVDLLLGKYSQYGIADYKFVRIQLYYSKIYFVHRYIKNGLLPAPKFHSSNSPNSPWTLRVACPHPISPARSLSSDQPCPSDG